MGLAIGIGVLADLKRNDEEGFEYLRKAFTRLNGVLAKNKLPLHAEPETLPPIKRRQSLGSFPYSFLHHLRRFAAHAAQIESWKPTPFPKSQNPMNDRLMQDEASNMMSHLLCHSDSEGFYIPLDSATPSSPKNPKSPAACSDHRKA